MQILVTSFVGLGNISQVGAKKLWFWVFDVIVHLHIRQDNDPGESNAVIVPMVDWGRAPWAG